MEKPFTIKINEFKQKLCEVINEANLSAYVLLNELNNMQLAIKQKDMQEINEYNESLKGSEEKCKK